MENCDCKSIGECPYCDDTDVEFLDTLAQQSEVSVSLEGSQVTIAIKKNASEQSVSSRLIAAKNAAKNTGDKYPVMRLRLQLRIKFILDTIICILDAADEDEEFIRYQGNVSIVVPSGTSWDIAVGEHVLPLMGIPIQNPVPENPWVIIYQGKTA